MYNFPRRAHRQSSWREPRSGRGTLLQRQRARGGNLLRLLSWIPLIRLLQRLSQGACDGAKQSSEIEANVGFWAKARFTSTAEMRAHSRQATSGPARDRPVLEKDLQKRKFPHTALKNW